MKLLTKQSMKIIFLLLCFMFFGNPPLISQTDVKTVDTNLNKNLSLSQEFASDSERRETQNILPQNETKFYEFKFEVKTQPDIWVDKLIAYTAPPDNEKHNPDKYFLPAYTEDEEAMNHRMKVYAEAFNLFSEYRKAEFPNGKTEDLERIAMDLEKNLDVFKKELLYDANRYIKEAEREIRSSVSRLARNIRLKPDKKPVVLNDAVLTGIYKKIRYAKNLFPGDPRIDDLNNQFDALKNEQRKWRGKMIDETLMLPDKFEDRGSADIKKQAELIVKRQFRAANVLRVNVIDPDWKEERVVEFTDTNQTSVRYRVTRTVTAQVAAGNRGECFLYSVNIAKDRLSTGGWSDLYGDIIFTDKILEENLDK